MRFLIPLLLSSFALGQGTRDAWERVRQFDADGDGKVSRDEFQGPRRLFDRLDADRDGFVTKEEAKSMRGGRGGGGMDAMLRRFDADGDGRVTKEEWAAFFAKADENGDEILQPEEMSAAMRGRPLHDPAPKVGDAAPKVQAASLADGKPVDLSKVRRATVLVFGSWT